MQKLPQTDIEQLFRRMVFNEVAKNYDDHVKNISFLMDRKGKWSLAPAYDMTFSYNPNSNQMKINGKREGIEYKDLISSGKNMDISNKKVIDIIEEINHIIGNWAEYAFKADLSEKHMLEIQKYHKLFDL